MDCKISWTNRAWLTYTANIEYLQRAWTVKEVSTFVLLVDKKLTLLARNPKMGSSRDDSHPDIRCTLIHKRVLLVYKYKSAKNEIDLLVFWNTAQNPGKLNVK